MTPDAPPIPQRHLKYSGTYNFRDTGGYPTHSGGATRWRTLLRSDSPHRLSEADRASLIEYGLRTAIDLRQAEELAEAPNVFAASAHVTYRHLPLLNDTPSMPEVLPSLVEIYRRILDDRSEQVGAALAALATPGALPAVVNCTAGKDRTGLIVALALGLAGVPEETIVADYALSGTYLAGVYLEEARQRAEARGFSYDLQVLCEPDFMRSTLAHLKKRYGGIEAYVRATGLGDAEINQLRRAVVA
jgi:protein-tyrosine phosphatase